MGFLKHWKGSGEGRGMLAASCSIFAWNKWPNATCRTRRQFELLFLTHPTVALDTQNYRVEAPEKVAQITPGLINAFTVVRVLAHSRAVPSLTAEPPSRSLKAPVPLSLALAPRIGLPGTSAEEGPGSRNSEQRARAV